MSFEETWFRDRVNDRALRGMLKAVCDASIEALDDCAKHPRGRLRDVLPYWRRVLVEERLRQVAFGPDFSFRLHEAPSMSCLIIEHPEVVVTAVSRSDFVHWVDPQRFRETLALGSQLLLLGSNEHDTSKRLHGLLIYGGPLQEPLPEHARIVFPDPEGRFAPGMIDLIAEFPEIMASYRPEPTAAPAHVPDLRLRPTAFRTADDPPPDPHASRADDEGPDDPNAA